MDSNVDFLAGDTWVSGEMPEIMRWLRRNAPVYGSEKNQLWVISKFEERAWSSPIHVDFRRTAVAVETASGGIR